MAPAKQSAKSAPAKKDDDTSPQKNEEKTPSDKKASTPVKSYKQKIIDGDKKTASTTKPKSNECLVFVTKTRSNDMIMLLERSNGDPPFVFLTVNELRRQEDFRRNVLRIHQMWDKVSHNNPNETEVVLVSGRERRFVVFVHIFEAGTDHLNNPVNRRLWADTFVHYFNHPDNRSLYTFPMTARFAGDLTPNDESTSPHMSRYLTIRDTMHVMQEALGHQDMNGIDLPIGYVLENEDAMNDYYAPEHLPLARQEFAVYARHSRNDTDGPFSGLTAFSYNQDL
jgi:hypothetical protein